MRSRLRNVQRRRRLAAKQLGVMGVVPASEWRPTGAVSRTTGTITLNYRVPPFKTTPKFEGHPGRS